MAARRLRPDFVLRTEDVDSLLRICRLVEGMPLAVELAAAWVDSLTLTGIAAELRNSLDILDSDLADLPERHRSIRTIFDATWRRLEPNEQEVFMRLSVFRGGLTREAALQVAGATLPMLARLIGNPWGAGMTLSALANLKLQAGDLAEARRLAEEAQAMRRQVGHRHSVGVGLELLARIALQENKAAEAAAYYEEAILVFDGMDNQPSADQYCAQRWLHCRLITTASSNPDWCDRDRDLEIIGGPWAETLWLYGDRLLDYGHVAEAEARYRKSLARGTRAGQRRSVNSRAPHSGKLRPLSHDLCVDLCVGSTQSPATRRLPPLSLSNKRTRSGQKNCYGERFRSKVNDEDQGNIEHTKIISGASSVSGLLSKSPYRALTAKPVLASRCSTS